MNSIAAAGWAWLPWVNVVAVPVAVAALWGQWAWWRRRQRQGIAQSALYLVERCGWSYDRIAQDWGMSRAQVRRLVAQARQRYAEGVEVCS